MSSIATEVLEAQPFSRMMGARITRFQDGEAVLEIPVRPDLLQQNGYVHGGVLAYAADNALTFAAGSVLGPRILTAGFGIDYLRPATGTLLRAVASTVNSSRKQALCRCEIFTVDAEGTETLGAAAPGSARLVDRPDPPD